MISIRLYLGEFNFFVSPEHVSQLCNLIKTLEGSKLIRFKDVSIFFYFQDCLSSFSLDHGFSDVLSLPQFY